MRGIVIDPGQTPAIVTLMPSDSQQLEAWIGGPFLLKPFGNVFAALAYSNAAGQALPCRHYAGRWYYGRLLLVGFQHNRITSLPPDLAQELAEKWENTEVQKTDGKKAEDVKSRKGYTPQKIRIAFECKQENRYQQAYEAIRDIMQNSAIPRNKKVWSIGMMIDAAESGMKRKKR